MNKPLILAAVLLAAPLALRADDEDGPASPASDAAAAFSTRGYRTEEAPQASSTGGDSAPIETRSDPRVISAPPQRPLGGEKGASRPASPGSGSGGAASAGISCEKSVPALTAGVARKEIDLFKIVDLPTQKWDAPPNGAVSYKFTAPASGGATLFATSGNDYRASPVLMTVSQTACDFDVEKARKKAPCYSWGPVESGFTLTIGAGAKGTCGLKPGAVYYYNIRTLTNPEQPNVRDGCADQFDYNPGPRGSKRWCGGIWQLRGGFSKEKKP